MGAQFSATACGALCSFDNCVVNCCQDKKKNDGSHIYTNQEHEIVVIKTEQVPWQSLVNPEDADETEAHEFYKDSFGNIRYLRSFQHSFLMRTTGYQDNGQFTPRRGGAPSQLPRCVRDFLTPIEEMTMEGNHMQMAVQIHGHQRLMRTAPIRNIKNKVIGGILTIHPYRPPSKYDMDQFIDRTERISPGGPPVQTIKLD